MKNMVLSRTKADIAGLVIGYALVRLVFLVIALVAAVPGLGSLLRGIKSAGLSSQIVFPLIVHYLPMFLTAFIVGCIAYRVLGGFRKRLFAALAAPWFLMGGYTCLVMADESLAECWLYSDALAFILSLSLVPLGLLLAALTLRRPMNVPAVA